MRVVALLFALVGFCFAANDIYVGGDFLLTLNVDDGDLNHVASLVSYDPDTDTYKDTFEGGVFLKTGFLNLLQETPLGIYGSGVFRFMDDKFDYCNSVLRYDNDDQDFKSVKDGIYLRSSESVNFIAGTSDYTYFAGVFNSIEYLSENSDDAVFVPNIARVNSDEEWSLLDNSASVFPSDPQILGLTCTDDTAFIYASSASTPSTLYSYDDNNGFTVLNVLSISGSILADSDGNLASFNVSGTSPGGGGGGSYLFVFFPQGAYDTVSTFPLYTITGNECENATTELTPTIILWSDGFLIAMPDVSKGCKGVTWSYFDPTNTTLTAMDDIPSVDDVDLLVEGDDNDLWLASHSSSILSYLPTGGQDWVDVDLSIFGTFTVYAMTWDDGPDKLLVYGTTSKGKKLIQVSNEAMPPSFEDIDAGDLYNPGNVNAFAVLNDADDDDYELFIGGFFDGIADGKQLSNLVRYKQGNYDTPIDNIGPIAALASYGSVVFYATTNCVGNTQQLPIGYYSKDSEEVWGSVVPTLIGSTGCVTALYADENYIFVGGSFTVLIPGSNTSGHAVIYFDKKTGEWKEIGIPNTIGSTGHAYDINSISVSVANGDYYVAFGGHFDFTVDGIKYHSFAISDISTGTWYNTPLEFDTDSVANEVLIDDISRIYIAGSLQLTAGGVDEGVFAYNVNSTTYDEVGNLPAQANAIILYNYSEDDVDNTRVYAGGDFVNGTNFSGLVYASSTASAAEPWNRAAVDSQFSQYFNGAVSALMYTTGGSGTNDTNGNDSSYTPPNSSSGGMSGWGIFFLTIFILLVVAVVLVLGAGGFVYFYRKRNNYQEL